MTLGSDDRVLLFSAADARDAATQTPDGIVVCVLEGDAVYDARRDLSDLTHVMVVPADPEGNLPWQNEFFSVIYAPDADEPSAEMLRVLAPGGRAIGRWGTLLRTHNASSRS